MIELYELRQFVVFADCGTLSEAAEVLHLSQPALSRNMKKLEEELGIPLFFRRKNRLELNENGTYVLGLAKQLLSMQTPWQIRPGTSTESTAPSLWESAPRPQAGC